MAQTGFTPILLYASNTATSIPSAGNLTNSANGAEVAVNTADKRLFTKDSGGAVVELGTNPSTFSLPNGTANGVLYLNGSKVATSGSALVFDGSQLGVGVSPSDKLTVAGTIASRATSASANFWSVNTGASNIGFFGNGSYEAYLQSVSGGGLLFGIGPSATEQMRLTSTGLGIGTSSPGAKLDVNGDTRTLSLVLPTASINANVSSGVSTSQSFMRFKTTGGDLYIGTEGSVAGGFFPSSAAYAAILYNPSSTPMQFYTAGTLRATLDSSGNLGLGVTPSAWGASSQALQNGGGSFFQYNNDRVFIGQNTYIDTSFGDRFIGNGYATRYRQYQGTHAFFVSTVSNSSGAGASQSLTQALTLDASGRLGIGLTNPAYRLDVEISAGPYVARFTNSSTSTSEYNVALFGQGAAGAAIGYIGTGGSAVGNASFANNFVVGTQSNNALVFNTYDTERARITSGGDLLVGTTATILSSKFASVAGASQNGGSFQTTAAANTYTAIAGARNGNNGNVAEWWYNLATQVGTISVTSTATAYNTSSDYRLKENPQPLTNSGAFIDALQPKTWNWKADGSRGVGFIAHEAQAVSPSSVVGEKDAVDADGKPVMQAMEYGSAEFIANIVAELQSLRARVAALEKP